jgi:hypothetical protein
MTAEVQDRGFVWHKQCHCTRYSWSKEGCGAMTTWLSDMLQATGLQTAESSLLEAWARGAMVCSIQTHTHVLPAACTIVREDSCNKHIMCIVTMRAV